MSRSGKRKGKVIIHGYEPKRWHVISIVFEVFNVMDGVHRVAKEDIHFALPVSFGCHLQRCSAVALCFVYSMDVIEQLCLIDFTASHHSRK